MNERNDIEPQLEKVLTELAEAERHEQNTYAEPPHPLDHRPDPSKKESGPGPPLFDGADLPMRMLEYLVALHGSSP